MTTLAPFQNGEFQLVVTEHEADGFRMQAPGLARALGFRDAYRLLETIPGGEKGYTTACTPGGEQRIGYVTEPGFYRALGQRQAARIADEEMRGQVERFQSWVYRDVLPAIRRTGSYGVATVPDLTTPAGILVMAEQFADTARALVASQQKVAELEPKADLADTYLIAEGGTRKVREAAKLLRMRERDLRRFLIDERLIFARHARCGDVQYDFYAEFAHHFQAIEHIVNHTWGSCSHYTLVITPRGIDLIRRRMAKVGLPADEAANQLTTAVSA
jgi:anti-repressor protein